MKKLLFTGWVLSALFLYSCQQEVDEKLNSTTNNAVTGDFRANINTAPWVANSFATASRMTGLINITGRSTDKKYISITLTDSGAHTYTLDDKSMNAALYIDSSANPVDFTTNQGLNPGDAGGMVRITSIDAVNRKISGTFSFNVFRQQDGAQRRITEGVFTDITYQTTLAPGNATDTFNVKIAGTLWVPSTVVASKAPPVGGRPAQIIVVGTDATGVKTVGLNMPADIVTGSYTLDFFGLTYIGQYNPDTDPQHSQGATSGTLTILSHDTGTHRIRGKFNFHGEALTNPALFTELTEGYFAVTYP